MTPPPDGHTSGQKNCVMAYLEKNMSHVVVDGDQANSRVPLVCQGRKRYELMDSATGQAMRFERLQGLLAELCARQGDMYWSRKHNANALTVNALTPAMRRRLGTLSVRKIGDGDDQSATAIGGGSDQG